MSRKCDICGKGPQSGHDISRRGLARKKDGAGRKITGVTKRWRYPNLQMVRIVINKTISKIKICTKCLKKGKAELLAH